MRLEDKVVQYLEFCRYRKELDEFFVSPVLTEVRD